MKILVLKYIIVEIKDPVDGFSEDQTQKKIEIRKQSNRKENGDNIRRKKIKYASIEQKIN